MSDLTDGLIIATRAHQAEIARLTAEVIQVRTEYEQLEIHNIKLDEKIAKLRALLVEAAKILDETHCDQMAVEIRQALNERAG